MPVQPRIEGVIIREIKKHADSRGWLAELFRHDLLEQAAWPVMAYASATKPGIARGPHEHRAQADLFCFLGPSDFSIKLWDNRLDSPTYREVLELVAGESAPQMIFVPHGVVHVYKNIGSQDGLVINCSNALYAGHGRREEVDEIRHEDDPDSPFQFE